ncbi:hypothetical protein CY34DRAFT_807861 [Suillus luteus UH-Slu-Lm8-n1]|uniref:Uncharacterized protein n=1 Tax=Suillus luteus UH-Slu-Lm8-n1 TaxID=930992 RepID=A0A0C9ZQ23_9AGAM|nr:hypothetical protein CY34DRAFT_807861 [Suillus luteus UH-Slu-Lm8-n1]
MNLSFLQCSNVPFVRTLLYRSRVYLDSVYSEGLENVRLHGTILIMVAPGGGISSTDSPSSYIYQKFAAHSRQ